MPQLIKNRALVDDRWTLRREVSSLGDLAAGAVPRSCRFRSGSRIATNLRRPGRRRRVARAERRSGSARRRHRCAAGDRRRLSAVHRRSRLFDRAPAARSLRIRGRAPRRGRRVCATSSSRSPSAASTRSPCATTAMRPRRFPDSTTSPVSTRRRRARRSRGFAGADPSPAAIPSARPTKRRGIIGTQVSVRSGARPHGGAKPSRPPAIAAAAGCRCPFLCSASPARAARLARAGVGAPRPSVRAQPVGWLSPAGTRRCGHRGGRADPARQSPGRACRCC